MPSPAEQVTDDLVSPKYDDDDEDEDEDATEEDESDDTVYECPGLAAPGQEMCVSNTFFLPWTTLSVLPDSHLHGTLRHTLGRPWQELSSHVLAQLEVATDHLKIRLGWNSSSGI